MISVVMPVYNGEKFLKQSIESILNQTYNDFEFIIINDGSTDNSLEIIKRYVAIDERIILISQENKGIVEALNKGIDISSGKYIARMDCDDISLPNRFKVQLDFMRENTNVDILGTYISAIGQSEDEMRRVEKWFNVSVTDKNKLERSLVSTVLCHPSIIMTSEFSKKNKYDSKYPQIEDYELFLRAISKGYKLCNIQEVLFKYRVHEDSKSHIERNQQINIIKQRISSKIKNLYNKKMKNGAIWGTGLGGEIFLNYINTSDELSEKINIKYVIDTYKKGLFNGIQIMSPDYIRKMNIDYIFITSTLGYDEISSFLNKLGFEFLFDYICVV